MGTVVYRMIWCLWLLVRGELLEKECMEAKGLKIKISKIKVMVSRKNCRTVEDNGSARVWKSLERCQGS